jgi:hypothetical protein
MTDDRKQRLYAITLATSPGMTEEEATRRLRGFLKQALRVFGLKCVEATEIKQSQKELDQ